MNLNVRGSRRADRVASMLGKPRALACLHRAERRMERTASRQTDRRSRRARNARTYGLQAPHAVCHVAIRTLRRQEYPLTPRPRGRDHRPTDNPQTYPWLPLPLRGSTHHLSTTIRSTGTPMIATSILVGTLARPRISFPLLFPNFCRSNLLRAEKFFASSAQS